ncbi:rRNA maturation RNase YbeY [Maribellus sp. CM-23]|uniref:rRNA maturation RNase YbeY n=1 Tax=Maribellus sp. CM-23 TaxID=2781026 RepID=UPI001F27C5B1|nr:rRNA maturation RNase YbeY [Maribellus sp. CM-23]MCE4564090.1 rRNA maturation RNase YbeY [Maribellus sp. CM-23]
MNSVEFYFEDIDPISIHENILNLQLNSLIEKELREIGDISVIFCSDEYLLKMNKEYLNHDYYTDIITFDYVEGNVISGDLFISVDRVKDNAVQFDSTLLKELYRVVFHGTLHLVGYKDKTEEEKVLMRSKEDFYLSEVDFKGLEK